MIFGVNFGSPYSLGINIIKILLLNISGPINRLPQILFIITSNVNKNYITAWMIAWRFIQRFAVRFPVYAQLILVLNSIG